MERAVIIRQNDDLSLSSLSFSPNELLGGADEALKSEDLIRVQSIFDLQEEFAIQISGEVNSPGKFPYANGMTVEDLVYLAGGFKESAAKSFVEVARRIKQDSEAFDQAAEIYNFKIDKNLGMSDSASTFNLRPFDIVVIRKSPFYENQIVVEIEGEVMFPGKYVLTNKEERISDIIKRAGGLTNYAYKGGAMLIRRTEFFRGGNTTTPKAAGIRRSELSVQFKRDTSLNKLDQQIRVEESIGLNLEKILEGNNRKYDLILKEGDVLSIPRRQQTVRIRGEVLYPNTVRFDETAGFKDLISSAGGFTDNAKKRRSYVIYANGKAKRTSGFLGLKFYPKVRPGSEIIVPPEKGESPNTSSGLDFNCLGCGYFGACCSTISPVSMDQLISIEKYISLMLKKKKSIILGIIPFFIVGVFFAYGVQPEYISSCKLLTDEDKGQNLGGLSGLAGIAGINLNLSNSQTISPDLYPQVVNSYRFIDKVWNTPISFGDTVLTSYDYFKSFNKPSLVDIAYDYTVGLPFKIRSLINDDSEGNLLNLGDTIVHMTKTDMELYEMFRERIQVELDVSTGVVTLKSEMPAPLAAAQLTKVCLENLTSEIITYKVMKSQLELDFVQSEFLLAEKHYNDRQLELATYEESNRNTRSPVVIVEKRKLENEYNLAFEIYKNLATKLEETKIKVKETTPVFSILEPIKVPVEKSSPKRILTMVGFLGLGVVVMSLVVMIKNREELV